MAYLSVLIIVVIAVCLQQSVAFDVPAEKMTTRFAPPPSKFIDINGLPVHYRDEGAADKPVLVLIHGTSSSLHAWDGWTEYLKNNWRIIRLDLPGYALTGPWAGAYSEQEYTGDAYARFMLDFLGALHITRFSVAGNSLGGEIAWKLAALVPKRITASILVDPIGYKNIVGALPLGWSSTQIPIFGPLLAKYTLPRFIIKQGLQLSYGDKTHIDADIVDHYRALSLRTGNRSALIERMRLVFANDGVEKITGVTAPTLLLWGECDQLVPIAAADKFLADIPNARLQTLVGLGHIPHEEAPKITATYADQFLKLHAFNG